MRLWLFEGPGREVVGVGRVGEDNDFMIEKSEICIDSYESSSRDWGTVL